MTEEALSSKVVYSGHILKLRIDQVRLPDGSQSSREIVEHGNAVAIVAVDADDNILLVKQYRRAAEKDLLEVPAGCVDPGEGSDATVIREMQEETGYRPNRIKRLGGFYSAPGFCTEYLHLYLATELAPSRLHAEDTDSIDLVRVPLDEVEELIDSGAICDAKSIAGLLFYLKSRK